MPFNLKQIKAQTRTVTGSFEGQEFVLKYYPHVLTPAMEKHLQASEAPGEALCEMVAGLIADWDLQATEEASSKLPITTDTLYDLPPKLTEVMLDAILQDMRVGEVKVGTLEISSSGAEGKADVPTGIS